MTIRSISTDSMNYIGSKYSLLTEIEQILADNEVPDDGVALDLFTGTAAVAQFLKKRGHVVYANDWQSFSYATAYAFLKFNTLPRFTLLFRQQKWAGEIAATGRNRSVKSYAIDRNAARARGHAADVIQYLNGLPGKQGRFYHNYCEGGRAGRKYFSSDNGQRIQAIRDQVGDWTRAGLVTRPEMLWLAACLIEAADRVANTASVYGAYLKHLKKSACKPLALMALRPMASSHPGSRHKVTCDDGLVLLRKQSKKTDVLTYIDPPYNHRQYASNYHILETICKWDLESFEPRGATGLRAASENRSDFCMRSRARGAFDRLLANVKSRFVLFSYNDEGLLSQRQLVQLFEKHYREVDFRRLKYQRFRADLDSETRRYKRDDTREFLILAKRKRSERTMISSGVLRGGRPRTLPGKPASAAG